jgi:hypothetical protein
MSARSRSAAATAAMWACAMPQVWLYGAAIDSNFGAGSGHRYSSAMTVLPGTVARTTRTPAARSCGTRVATTFSMPPYPFGGTGSHGPAFIRTVNVIGVPRSAPAVAEVPAEVPAGATSTPNRARPACWAAAVADVLSAPSRVLLGHLVRPGGEPDGTDSLTRLRHQVAMNASTDMERSMTCDVLAETVLSSRSDIRGMYR